MNKKVIYTCLVGNYDSLMQPEAIDPAFDYICFTDRQHEASNGVWQYRDINLPSLRDGQGTSLSPTRLSRYPKLLPHEVLSDYDYSVYMDANVQILDPAFYDAVNAKIASGCLIAQVRHTVPPADCIYDEITKAFYYNKVTLLQAWQQTRYLRSKAFPKHFGLFENNLIFRRHCHEKVAALSRQWWEEFCKYAPRDQFSLMYLYWKNQFMPELLLSENECTRNSHLLRYVLHTGEQTDNATLTECITRRLHRITYPLVKRLL